MIERELLQYGYLFVLLGVVTEGDTTLVTASFLAHRGDLKLSWVLILSAAATFAMNQVYFALARRKGSGWLERRALDNPRFGKIVAWAGRRGAFLVFLSRFLIGFRTVIPIVCGASGVKPGSFTAWNAAGAAVWAGAFGAAGYLGAHALSVLLHDLRHHEAAVAVAVACSLFGYIVFRTHGREWLDILLLRRSSAK